MSITVSLSSGLAQSLRSPAQVEGTRPSCSPRCAIATRNRLQRNRHASVKAAAQKKGTAQQVSADPGDSDEWRPEDDPDFVAALNEVCNKGVRVMLDENMIELRSYVRELDELGTLLAKENNVPAMTFLYVLYQMCDHKLATTQVEKLEGLYAAAFEKMYAVLEDSGWKLVDEKEEGEGQEMVDEELMQPPANLSYFG